MRFVLQLILITSLTSALCQEEKSVFFGIYTQAGYDGGPNYFSEAIPLHLGLATIRTSFIHHVGFLYGVGTETPKNFGLEYFVRIFPNVHENIIRMFFHLGADATYYAKEWDKKYYEYEDGSFNEVIVNRDYERNTIMKIVLGYGFEAAIAKGFCLSVQLNGFAGTRNYVYSKTAYTYHWNGWYSVKELVTETGASKEWILGVGGQLGFRYRLPPVINKGQHE